MDVLISDSKIIQVDFSSQNIKCFDLGVRAQGRYDFQVLRARRSPQATLALCR